MDEALEILRKFIADTPGAAAQLKLASDASHDGRHAESQIHCAIAADKIVLWHLDVLSDPIALSKALQRYFLE